jgi:putative holliday junction resolvase
VSAVIGLDHGVRRVGVAVGDTETGMAFERPALHRRGLATDLHAIERLAWNEHADVIVLGLPLNMDGSEGEQAASVRAFGDALAELGLTIEYSDERLTSWDADQRLKEAGRRTTRESGDRDSAAARLILQQYLDAHRRATGPEESE